MLTIVTPAQRFAALRSFVNANEARSLYSGVLLERRLAGCDPLSTLYTAYERAEGNPLRRMRYVDIESYLADDLMTKIDVASMAHGLEVRAPLLDHDVLQFALSLPDEFVFDNQKGKRILRDLVCRYLPAQLFDRRKQGFSIPLARWFENDLKSRMEHLSHSKRLRELGVVRPEAIRNLLAETAAGLRDNTQRLFSLLMLDEWLAIKDS